MSATRRSRRSSPPRLRAKAVRVAAALARLYGVPRWSGPRDPVACLVETIISQNTTDRARDAAYAALVARFPTWEALAAAPERDVRAAIRGAGLAEAKARTIRRLLAMLLARYGAYRFDALKAMTDDEAIAFLTTVSGIGVKTAAIALAFALGRDVFPVDTHVNRLCGRLGLVPESSAPDRTFRLMRAICPPGQAYAFHVGLITHGRRVCRAPRPKCEICALRSLCRFHRETPIATKLPPGTGGRKAGT
ncbi:MAG: endonuclease III [Planctomycetes bacterium]|nr:endonuclease III [Planctomycetota bacterium]